MLPTGVVCAVLAGLVTTTVLGMVEVETELPGFVVVAEVPMVDIETVPVTLAVGAARRADGGGGGIGGGGIERGRAFDDLLTGSVNAGATTPRVPSEMTLSVLFGLRGTDSVPSPAYRARSRFA